MGLEAGRLIHLVDIQQYEPAQNQDTGEPLASDENWATESRDIFAEVLTLSGRDFVQAMQSGYAATHKVTIYWRPGIRPKTTRFLFEGVPLYVIHPTDLEGRKYALECLCRSGDTP